VAEQPFTRARLVLYSRNFCHLCEEMYVALDALRGDLRFDLDVVDVDSDPQLEQHFNELVPVLMHGDRELARWRLDSEALRAYLSEIS
jgi:hypothetical protein